MQQLALSADERTVILYCLGDYCASVANSDAEIDLFLETSHLSSAQAQNLIDQLYTAQVLTASLCDQVTNALWAWKATVAKSEIPVEPIYNKLLSASGTFKAITA